MFLKDGTSLNLFVTFSKTTKKPICSDFNISFIDRPLGAPKLVCVSNAKSHSMWWLVVDVCMIIFFHRIMYNWACHAYDPYQDYDTEQTFTKLMTLTKLTTLTSFMILIRLTTLYKLINLTRLIKLTTLLKLLLWLLTGLRR